MGSFNFKTMSTSSAVVVASMVTLFVPSRGSHSVSQSSPGAWLILRPEDGTWNLWGRLEAWRERSCFDAIGYRFELLTCTDVATTLATVGYRFELLTCTDVATTLAANSISSKNGGKFSIDRTFGVSNTPGHTTNNSYNLGSGSRSLLTCGMEDFEDEVLQEVFIAMRRKRWNAVGFRVCGITQIAPNDGLTVV